MYSHIMIGTNDIEESKIFYDSLFDVLGAKPGRIFPNQSPILLGTGKFRPNPKMTNIPIMASIIATIRCHVMASRRIAAANNVLQTGVR